MSVGVKIFVGAVYNNQLQTNTIYKGGLDGHTDLHEDGDINYEYVYFQLFYFEGCGCSRGCSPAWDQTTEVLLTGHRRENDAELQYQVDCRFYEVHEDGGDLDPVDDSSAATWIRSLFAS